MFITYRKKRKTNPWPKSFPDRETRKYARVYREKPRQLMKQLQRQLELNVKVHEDSAQIYVQQLRWLELLLVPALNKHGKLQWAHTRLYLASATQTTSPRSTYMPASMMTWTWRKHQLVRLLSSWVPLKDCLLQHFLWLGYLLIACSRVLLSGWHQKRLFPDGLTKKGSKHVLKDSFS